MVSSTSEMLIILLWFLCAITTFNLSMCYGNLNVLCNKEDQQALSNFKQSLKDPSQKLSSWSNEEDCCKWAGVQCDNITGRVTMLDLHCSFYDLYEGKGNKCLGGKINFSLLNLEFLNFLDLHGNDFEDVHIPPNYCQRSHNLSLLIPLQACANFSNLHYLDLSENYNLYMDNLEWILHFSSLKSLNLSVVSLYNETRWLQWMTMLPSLVELRLSGCHLYKINPSLQHANFSSLTVLDLSDNYFKSEVPKWLSNLNGSIAYLDLSQNYFRGQIPEGMLNFRNLKFLRLSWNNLNGSIPKWMGHLNHLEHLDISNNLFCGPIPPSLGNLSSLTFLDVSSNCLNGSLPNDLEKLSKLEYLWVGHNSLAGILSEQSFTKLSMLKSLMLDSSAFIFDLGSYQPPPFQLEYLSMTYCMLGPEFPSWLYTQRSLSYLDISGSGLSFSVEDRFWNFVANIDFLFLSNNSISGDISALMINSTTIDLESNNFSGRLPRISPKVKFFNIANNSFSGPISPLLCQSINGKQELVVLDMSYNRLSGEIPDCWMHWQSLIHVNLGSNNLTGEIPDSMGSLIKLKTLRLGNNSLFGKIPPSLQSCKRLWFLDLEFNQFSGNIPGWIRQVTMVLLLRSNKFYGSIPSHICQLPNLLVLDLANNELTGSIPECLHMITPMVTNTVDEDLFVSYFYDWDLIPISASTYLENLPLFVKGREDDYWKNLVFVRIVDLSSNDLQGPIPPDIFFLVALQSLNLSHNHLTGKVPYGIGDMKFLESLDLSSNQLSGEIPQSLSNLSFLSHLNLSYNKFKGRIPLGTQLQGFDVYCYIGNPELCGAPLTKNCTQEETHECPKLSADNEDDFRSSFYIGAGVGFAFGFWAVCGTLFFNRKWRRAFFRHPIVLS